MSLASGVGLVSGLNFNEIITKIRQVNSRPIALVQAQAQKMQTQRSALQSINKLVVGLKEKAEALADIDDLTARSATTTDSQVVTAEAGNTAVAGSYSVKVRQLAQAHRIASQGVASLDTAIAAAPGSFEFKVGDSSSVTVEVTGGMTLQQLADAINKNAGVRASVVNDGTASNPHRLVLSGSATGAANTISIVQNDTTLNLSTNSIEAAHAAQTNQFNGTVASSGVYTGTTNKQVMVEVTTGGALGAAKYKVSYDGGLTWGAADAYTTSSSPTDLGEGINISFTADAAPVDFAVGDRFSIDAFVPQLQQAQNAIIEVDGIQVSRDTNTFENVIEGVKLNARKVDEDAQTIRVSINKGVVTSRLQEFVEAYNTLQTDAKRLTAYDVKNNQAAALFGDSGITVMLSGLRSSIAGTVGGLSVFTSLNAIGVSTDGDGLLKIDQTALSEALDKDMDAVLRVLGESGESASGVVSYKASTADTRAGQFSVNITTAAERASVTGALALAGGLGLDESLRISLNTQTMNVALQAGMTLEQIVERINQTAAERGINVQASDDGGKLRIESVEYGAAQEVRVASDRAADLAGQLGIGTSTISDKGVDVAGTIDGATAIGEGRLLKGRDGSAAAGLELEISALTPLTTTVTVTRGVAKQMLQRLEALTDSESGLFATREDGYEARLESYEKRIESLQSRIDAEEQALQKKFTALETKLSALKSQGDYLLSQLASLVQSQCPGGGMAVAIS